MVHTLQVHSERLLPFVTLPACRGSAGTAVELQDIDPGGWLAGSLWQKSHTTRFAGESACATSMDQLFAAPSGADFSLPRLLPQAAKQGNVTYPAKFLLSSQT